MHFSFARGKRLLACIVALSLCAAAACSDSKKIGEAGTSGDPKTTASSSLSQETSGAPTNTPTPTLSPTPTETPTPSPSPTPTGTPTPVPEYIEPIITGGAVWYNGYVDPRSVRAEVVANPDDVAVLVNKYYAQPKSYVPELVYAKYSAGQQLRPDCAKAWEQMHDACMSEIGQDLYLISGYRDWATQTYSFNNAITRRGLDKACCKNAYPGRSEHPLGLALDMNIRSDPEIRDNFVYTKAGQWVLENGHKYGFIWRYPEGFGHITGYGVEGWHFRYVGVDVATEMHEKGIKTLEEYYGKPQVLPDNE